MGIPRRLPRSDAQGLAVSNAGDEYRLLAVPTGLADWTGPQDWTLYRQSNGGDGVTPQAPLADHLQSMLDLYYAIDT